MDTLTVAYFSMEFAVDPKMPTYSGGLGVLAGDAMRAAADLGIPAVGITLLHRKGYFQQHLDSNGNQSESYVNWPTEEFLELLPPRVLISIAGRQVQVQAWRYMVHGEFGYSVPVYFLDTSLPQNSPEDQSLTDYLYGGDARYRLCQEVILGFAGMAILRALGYRVIQAYHMNESHSALVTLALLEEQSWGRSLDAIGAAEREAVIQHCVFTTHTPLPMGHDEFPINLVREVLGNERADFLMTSQCSTNDVLSMTDLAMKYSCYINGVSMRHEDVSRTIISNHKVNSITNGVHAMTWTSPAFRRLYDRFIPQWRRDNLYLKYAIRIPLDEIQKTHTEAKQELLTEVERRTGMRLDPQVMTIGFARRATEYKRHDLLFYDLEQLRGIVRKGYLLQIIYGGKAHPRDEGGKALIKKICEAASAMKNCIPVVYLEEYDMSLAKNVCSGVDLWLNTPQKPHEASGTSGMKAALNGVPTFSILDGWWIEGHIEGVTGWSIGDGWRSESNIGQEVTSLYNKLEQVIVPMYYEEPNQFASIMRSAIALNGSYFNAQRMVTQYLQNAYLHPPNINVMSK
jgi:starch phosphorylase